MIPRNRIRSVLWLLLLVLALPSRAAYAQMGSATGTVKLRKTDGSEARESQVKVCLVLSDAYKEAVRKGGKILCTKTAITNSDGTFISPLIDTGQVQAFPSKKGYAYRDPARDILIPNGATIGTDPPPFLLYQIPTPTPTPRGADTRRPARAPVDATPAERRFDSYVTVVRYGGGKEPQDKQQGETGPQEKDATPPTPTPIKGKVTDSQDNPLSEVDVALYAVVSDDDDAELIPLASTKTDNEGAFTLTVPAERGEGTYLFSITRDDYEPLIMPLEMALSKFPPCNSGDPCQTVQLVREDELSETEAPMVNMEEAARRYIFTPEVMQRLPLPGFRSFDAFVLLAPGVLPPPESSGAGGLGLAPGFGSPGQFSVNGLRSRENNFTFDGSDNNDEDVGTRRQGFVVLTPQPVESLKELQVITALRDARFGRNIGGEINALTETGSNEYHGSLYGFVTNDRLNARDAFDRETGPGASTLTLRRSSDNAPVLLDGRPLTVTNPAGDADRLTRTQAGFTGGGPFPGLANTFLFGSFEHLRQRGDKESHFAVPTVAQRGAFGTGETGFLIDGFNPRVVPLFPATAPGNAIFSLYPFPNDPVGPYGPNTYTTVLPRDADAVRFSTKLNTQFGQQQNVEREFKWWRFFWAAGGDTLTGRYNFTQEKSVIPVTGDAIYSAQRPRVRTQNVAFFLNRQLAPNLFDSIRFSFGRTRLSFKEVRDPSLIPSTFFPDTPFLLNAPLLLNVTAPTPGGGLNPPAFVSAASAAGAALLNPIGYSNITTAEQLTGPLG